MPSVNSRIETADYNLIRDKIVAVMGNGVGNLGYGQQTTLNSTAVATGSKVTINEWANLRFDLINAYKHIYGSNPITAVVSEGNIIRYTNTFTPDTGALDVPQRQYDEWANTITTNRFTVAAGESVTTAAVSSTRSSAWSVQCLCVIQVYFASADQARYWFNSGGQVRISASRSGGQTVTQNTSWTNLLAAAGTQTFGAVIPAAGTSPTDGANWYRTNSTFQTYYSATASNPYGANNYQLQARCVDVPSNSLGLASALELRVVFNEGYVDPAIGGAGAPSSFPPGDSVDGTLQVNVSTLYATGIMVPAGQTFTVANPTVGVGAITGDVGAAFLPGTFVPKSNFASTVTLSTYNALYPAPGTAGPSVAQGQYELITVNLSEAGTYTITATGVAFRYAVPQYTVTGPISQVFHVARAHGIQTATVTIQRTGNYNNNVYSVVMGVNPISVFYSWSGMNNDSPTYTL